MLKGQCPDLNGEIENGKLKTGITREHKFFFERLPKLHY